MTDSIDVFVDMGGETVQAGRAHFTHRGSLSTTFEYDRAYLARPGC